VEAEWRVAEAEVAQAAARLRRLEATSPAPPKMPPRWNGLAMWRANWRAQPPRAMPPPPALPPRAKRKPPRAARTEAQGARDAAASTLAAAKADLAGVEREYQALLRDREARAKAQKNASGRRLALDHVRAAPGYERALAAVLGRDAKAPLGAEGDGRFWTGAAPPPALPQSLAAHVADCPPELAARLALVQVAEVDDGRALPPGVWLVTLAGHVRRWDLWRAARARRKRRGWRPTTASPRWKPRCHRCARPPRTPRRRPAPPRPLWRRRRPPPLPPSAKWPPPPGRARRPARAGCRRGRARRLATRRAELAEAARDLAAQRDAAPPSMKPRKPAAPRCPCPMWAALLEAPRPARGAGRHQAATARLAAQDQALAVARERVPRRRAVAGAGGRRRQRLGAMAAAGREIAAQRAIAAKPEGLEREIAEAGARRAALAAQLAEAEAALAQATQAAQAADRAGRRARGAGQRARGPRRRRRPRRKRRAAPHRNEPHLGRALPVPAAAAARTLRLYRRGSGRGGREHRPWTGCRRSASGSARSIWWPPRNWPRRKRAPRIDPRAAELAEAVPGCAARSAA
jgi:chromosome segregation protein